VATAFLVLEPFVPCESFYIHILSFPWLVCVVYILKSAVGRSLFHISSAASVCLILCTYVYVSIGVLLNFCV
jgi:ABC-type transport system involved in cytochrome bd biosynthesis fused ATPase/permease subunit